MAEPFELSASEGLEALESGALTAEAWTKSCLERIADVDSDVEAWAHLDSENAVERAQEIDRVAHQGAARGIPFGAKDIIDTVDMPTEYGTPIHKGYRPGRDASCIAIMRAAGGVLLGKTVTTEFGHLYPGKSKNPVEPAYSPGGSSTGSAAAVGAKMVPFALGTQTTGSLIRPAAYCGTVGYKPTLGDFSNVGVMPNTPSGDTLGVIARSVADVSLVRSILLEETHTALTPTEMSQLKVGFYPSPYWEQAADYVHQFMEEATSQLSKAGADVFDAQLPMSDPKEIDSIYARISGYEFARSMAFERFTAYGKLSAALRDGRMQDGLVTSHSDYRKARTRLEKLRLEMDDWFSDFDVLITPSAQGEPPKGQKSTGGAIFNGVWTALGVPAITLPLSQGPNGLPLGLQLVARRGNDEKLFSIADAVYRNYG